MTQSTLVYRKEISSEVINQVTVIYDHIMSTRESAKHLIMYNEGYTIMKHDLIVNYLMLFCNYARKNDFKSAQQMLIYSIQILDEQLLNITSASGQLGYNMYHFLRNNYNSLNHILCSISVGIIVTSP